MTREHLLKGMALIEAAVDKAFTNAQVALWQEMLEDLDARAFLLAVQRCIQEMEFPSLPTVGRIRRYADEAIFGIDSTSDEAFALVRQAARRFDDAGDGQREAAAFLGERVWAVVEGVGGFRRFTAATVEDYASLYAQFRDTWHARVDRQRSLRRLQAGVRPRLAGPDGLLRELPGVDELSKRLAAPSTEDRR